jgi:hypothetical protein
VLKKSRSLLGAVAGLDPAVDSIDTALTGSYAGARIGEVVGISFKVN